MKYLPAFLLAFFGAMTVLALPVFASEPTFGEKMAQAGRNTVIGLVTVFVILLALSLIIGLFRFIAPKKKAKALVKTEFVNKKPVAKPSVDDEELAAVIIAAICAAEGTDYVPGQYRLRSIRKIRYAKSWNRTRRDA